VVKKLKKRNVLSLGVALGVGLLLSQDVQASGNLEVTASSEYNKISLDWNDIGHSYALYKDNIKIWEGNESNYILSNLESKTKYNYTLVALDQDENPLNKSSIRTTTTKNDLNIKVKSSATIDDSNPMSNIYVSSFVNEDSVNIEWEGTIPDENGVFEVYRDGELIGTTITNSFSDNTIENDKKYRYEIVGNKRLSDTEIERLKENLKKQNIKQPLEEKDFYNTNKLIRVVKTNDNNKEISKLAKSNSFNTMATQNYTVRYNTFIPTEYAENPFTGGGFTGLTYFGGDDRGFDTTSNRFRTRSDVNISFTGTGSSVSLAKTVNPTILYDYMYRPLDVKVASNSGITMTNVSKTASKVSFKINHDVGIPYGDAFSPDITYSYTATVYKDGGYNISGSHDKAPSHEMEIFIPYSDMFDNLHQFSNQGFKYLWPTYSNENFNASW
jgi:Protein of unknown function (DUF3238)